MTGPVYSTKTEEEEARHDAANSLVSLHKELEISKGLDTEASATTAIRLHYLPRERWGTKETELDAWVCADPLLNACDEEGRLTSPMPRQEELKGNGQSAILG